MQFESMNIKVIFSLELNENMLRILKITFSPYDLSFPFHSYKSQTLHLRVEIILDCSVRPVSKTVQSMAIKISSVKSRIYREISVVLCLVVVECLRRRGDGKRN